MPRPSLSWLLVFVPVSIVAQVVLQQPVLVFVTSCLAIVPLAGLIGSATDQLAIRAGPRVGGLLNASFGNVTELILGGLLVGQGEIAVVKASLIGSIMGNLVLVLGASYLAGGLRFKEQRFSGRAASVHSSSLLLAVAGLIMPAIFVDVAQDTAAQRYVVSATVAGVLIVLYLAALLFTLRTHTYLFQVRPSEDVATWSPARAVLVLLVSGLVVGVESELLVVTLEPTLTALHLSREFVGLFIISFVGNAAEHSSAVLFALRNQMEVAIEIAFSSSTQIALLVAPMLVFASIPLGHPMDFVFTTAEVTAVAVSTVIVSVNARDGRSNWLQGLQLLGMYTILGISLFYVGK